MNDPADHARHVAQVPLRFVESAADLDVAFEGLTVVLDPGWTPGPHSESGVFTVLPAFSKVLEQHDLFNEALELVDAWADRTDIVDRLVVEGVSYWLRLRESMWHWVHERLLWRYTFKELGIGGGSTNLSIPWLESALIDVAVASGGIVDIVRPPEPVAPQPSARTRIVRRLPGFIRRSYRRLRPHPDTIRIALERAKEGAREELLAARFVRLGTAAGDRILVLSQPQSHQQVGLPAHATSVDPNLDSIFPGLEAAKLDTMVVGWGIPRGSDEFWPLVEADDRYLPGYFVRAQWSKPEDSDRVETSVNRVKDRLLDLTEPLDVNGLDLAGPFVAEVIAAAERVIAEDIRDVACIERLLSDLAPRAVLMTHEGHKTPWLMAAARFDIPTFALQHGVLYARHPGYPEARDPRYILPTCTFVFGDFERRALRAMGYAERQVQVSGSPRLDLDASASDRGPRATARAVLRKHLGVADGDRLLVVSTGWYPFMRRSHIAHMLATLLGGPLPGVHVVFKQHPGERDEGPYRSLLSGLAAAGGYEPPAISVIKDVDLYGLLRAADAHLSHQSTVLTEAVVIGMCNLVADVQASPPPIDYVGAGVAWPVRSIADVRAAMRDLPPPPDLARRAFLDDHFRAGHAGRTIAAAIASAVSPRS